MRTSADAASRQAWPFTAERQPLDSLAKPETRSSGALQRQNEWRTSQKLGEHACTGGRRRR